MHTIGFVPGAMKPFHAGHNHLIQKAIAEVYTEKFKSKIQDTKNPYGNGGASLKIIQSLKKIEFGSLKLKPFHDIKVN